MRITLKLYATLSDRLPAGASRNAADIEIDERATLHDVIDRFNVPRDLAHLVMINGVYQPGDVREQPGVLQEGDTLAIWPPVAGG